MAISACLDSNIYISAIAFGGTPLKVLERAVARDFSLITSLAILEEVRRNLVHKLGVAPGLVDQTLQDILSVSSAFVPTGRHKYTGYQPDNLIIETAMMGGADILVTGDRQHLLPLNPFLGMIIESPRNFLARLDRVRAGIQ